MDNNNSNNNNLRATKIAIIIILALAFVATLLCCIILSSGKDGQNGANGTATAITGADGKVALDGQSTAYDSETLSAMINVSANNQTYGKVSGSGRYPMNKAVIISAEPNNGYVFVCWQNGDAEEISREQNFLTRASEAEQTYIAVFEIDKNNVKIDVSVRADSSLPNSVSISGAGNYRYGEEYSLQVTSSNETDLENGKIFYYEVTKEQYEDENFVITDAMNACAYGELVVFDVDDIENKYYIVAFKENEDDGTINIIIDIDCDISLVSSNDSYGKATIIKINDKEVGDTIPSIWQGDIVTIKATPDSVSSSNYGNGFGNGVERSNFVCWCDTDTGEIVSTNKEYSFVAKRRVHLKAEFSPKTVLVYRTGESAPRVDIKVISNNGSISKRSSYKVGNEDALASYEYGEKIIIYASYWLSSSYGFTDRYNKFYWEISYDGTNWQTLSYDKQTFIEIPENVDYVYITVSYDKKSL